jgi:multidrug efflux pump subunit AcrB
VKIPSSLSVVKLYQICQIYAEPETPSGFHLFNRKKGLVITVHKQAEARMPEVMPEIYQAVEQFRKNYPTIDFHLTQDQSQLLTLSIQNLSQSLAWGGLFAFAVLFAFMGGWREPVVMGIILPISLMLSFSFLYLLNISLNIISLSGLALGLGMLVDNSIVVIDNIVSKRKTGQSLIDSCVDGTKEVTAPLISSALTNLAVFMPLIFMSGITGALFYDQAIAVSCILFVSIVCTFVFVPLLYSLFNQNRMLNAKEDTRFFLWLKEKYHRSFEIAWKNKTVTAIGMGLFIPLSIVLFLSLPKEGFPEIERSELVLTMDWNEPITIDESLTRIQQFLASFDSAVVSECDIGHQQFILKMSDNSTQQAELYLRFVSQRERKNAQSTISDFFKTRYPMAAVEMQNAPNAFEQLFISRTPLYEVRIRNSQSKNTMPVETAEALLRSDSLNFRAGKGFETESMVFIDLDFDKMKLYNVSFVTLRQKLQIIFGDYQITSLKNFGENIRIVFAGSRGSAESILRTTEVFSENGARYPIREFVKIQLKKSYKNITADASGTFQSLITNHIDVEKTTREHINSLLDNLQLTADFTGTWFEEQKNIEQIIFILFVSFLLMYFIITAEFESFTQPLIVMLSIPIGLAGSLILLWMSGGSINVMSAIGLVVVLGILDNDAILKIDRINSLRKKMDLENAVFQAGMDRFKPIVMNTCTNVLALTPILFTSSLGGDLQRPVAITTIGGLIVATVAALYFVPILYWSLHKRHSKT